MSVFANIPCGCDEGFRRALNNYILITYFSESKLPVFVQYKSSYFCFELSLFNEATLEGREITECSV